MGLRLVGSHKAYIDELGEEETRVEIHDTQGGGSLPIRIVSYNEYTDGNARDPMTIMNPKRAECTFLIEDETYEEFITDLGEAVEDRFIMRTYVNGQLFFAGIVVHEFISWDDAPYPFEFTISAVDGITRMRDLDFLDENGDPFEDLSNDNWFSMMDLIIKAFNTLNLDAIYGGSDDRFRIYVQMDWSATNQQIGSGSPLETIYCPIDLFYEYDNDDNLVAKSSYYVVEEILKAFAMRVEYGRGFYKIEQVTSRRPTANAYQAYTWNSTTGTSRAFSGIRRLSNNKDGGNMTEARGRFEILPPLRQVRVSYDYELFKVAAEPDPVYGFGGTGTGKVCYLWDNGTMRPALDNSNLPADIRFRVTAQLMVKTTYTGITPDNFQEHRYRVRFYLGVSTFKQPGGYIYKRHMSGFDPEPGEAEWVADALLFQVSPELAQGGYDYITPIFQYQGAAGTPPGYYDIGFETLPYPENTENTLVRAYLCAELVEIITEDGTPLSGDHSVEWAVSDFTVIVTEDNEKAKPTKKQQVFTSRVVEGGKDSVDIKILFGSKGDTLKVDTGSGLDAPLGWGTGTGGGSVELGQLLADEYHKVRGNPIKLMQRGIIGRRNSRNDNFTIFSYNSAYWACMISDHHFWSQTIRGTWWEIKSAYSSPPGVQTLQAEIAKEYNRIGDPIGDPAVLPESQDPGWDGNGFTAGDTRMVFRDGTLPDKTTTSEYKMRKKVYVYRNGQKLLYVEATPVGPYQFSIDNNDNSVTFDTNFPLSQRHVIEIILKHG